MGFSIALLNEIRNEASQDYQSHIPEATQNTISAVGNALASYTTLFNEFSVALMNKIGKTQLEQALFKNKLAKYKTGTVVTQQDVEEIYIPMAEKASAYDPDGKNPLGRRDVAQDKVVYHRQNRQDEYCISLGDIDFVRCFRSEATLDAYLSAKLSSVYVRADYDEWLIMKNLLATYDGYTDYQVPELTDATAEKSAKAFVKTLRKAVMDVSFMKDTFNKAGVMTKTDANQLTLFVHKDLVAEIDVEVLAKAFNMGKTDIEVDIEVMDDFGTLENTYALLVDRSWFKVYDTLSHMEPQRNAQGLFTNFFYHVHQIVSASPFKNTIRFTTETVA